MTFEKDPPIRFRPLRRQDFPLLSTWLSRPHVQEWWREDFAGEALEERYGPVVDGTDPTECFVVGHEGSPVGFIQRYLFVDNPAWQSTLLVAGAPAHGAGIDFFIGDVALIGVGMGPRMIAQFVEATWHRYPEVPAIVVNVSPENRRSWRALEKAGFARIWSGLLESDDPSDVGPSHVYRCGRPESF